ncbi:ERCC1 protein, partial [Calonectris borealis]|nr:ERCC1 protein [Calonectris borealis]
SPDPPRHPQMTDCLTSIKSVNKTDALSLLTTFGRLFDVLHEPFLKVPKGAAAPKISVFYN